MLVPEPTLITEATFTSFQEFGALEMGEAAGGRGFAWADDSVKGGGGGGKGLYFSPMSGFVTTASAFTANKSSNAAAIRTTFSAANIITNSATNQSA